MRYLHTPVLADLQKKMVMLSGPRQVGKTYMARELMKSFQKPQYLNYDNMEDARVIQSASWPQTADLVVFDEVHKMPTWKPFLKGAYDVKPPEQAMLVTGSARLDTFRQSGESLAGRYFHFRLHPISVKEMAGTMPPHLAVETLNRLGGFPEPFLSGSDEEAARWRNQYYTDLIREDILDFGRVHELRAMKFLLEMLRTKVGATLSYTSLANDLQLAPNTVRRYVDMLEALHIIFLVRPFHTNVARAILKEPKLYFFDSGYVQGDQAVRLENTVAASLLKYVNYELDVHGRHLSLHYIRTKQGKEVDFAISDDGRIDSLVEVKLGDTDVPSSLRQMAVMVGAKNQVLAVHNLRQERLVEGVRVVPAGEYLASLTA